MMKIILSLFLMMMHAAPSICQSRNGTAEQTALPFREIPASPQSFTAESVVVRMIDGLGFRFYWATDSLRAEDLLWKPSASSRTSEETTDHIMNLAEMLFITLDNRTVSFTGEETSSLPFAEKRKRTLQFLWNARNLLDTAGKKLSSCPIVFENKKIKQEFPFWNMINGPVEDALWHTGQVVSFRRSSGNPVNPKVGFFTGKLME